MRNLKKKLLFCLFCQQKIKISNTTKYVNYKWLRFRLSEYSYGSIRDSVARLVKIGAVDKLLQNNQVKVKITSLGKELLTEEIPALKLYRKWDKYWYLVTVSGKDNIQISAELKKIGFKRFLRGVWINYTDKQKKIRQLTIKNQWDNQLYTAKINNWQDMEPEQLARKLWSLEETQARYENIIKLIDRVLRIAKTNLILLQQSKGGFKQVLDEYFLTVSQDPGLPDSLLGSEWLKKQADSYFYRLMELAEKAKI